MPRAPFVVTALVLAAGLSRAVSLVLDPEPFDPAPAAVLSVWFTAFGVVVVAGLLIARSRWARTAALLLVGASLGLALVVPLAAPSSIALLVGGAALAGVTGPWLTRRWLRLLSSIEGPPGVTVVLVLGVMSMPAVIALARPGGLGTADWLLVVAGVTLAAGLSRASWAALWATRVAVPILTAFACVAAGLPAGGVIAAGGASLAVAAWSPQVGRSVSPLSGTRSRPVPIPPELVDPGVLRAAGYDEAGRPRREGPA